MPRWTIRQGMVGIAGIGVFLGGCVGLVRMGGLAPLLGVSTICEITHSGQCARNLRNIVLSTLAYVNRTGHFPQGTWANPDLAPEKRLSWYATILPEIDCPEYWEALDKGQSSDAPANLSVAGTRIGVLVCPQSTSPPPEGLIPATYIGIAGLGAEAPVLPKGHPRAGVFGYDRRTTLKDITDGTSFTMVLAESGRVQGSWLAGGPATVRGLDTADRPYLGPGRQFSGLHENRGMRGANVAFADGSVRFIRDTVNPKLFEAVSTIAGRESVPPDVFR